MIIIYRHVQQKKAAEEGPGAETPDPEASTSAGDFPDEIIPPDDEPSQGAGKKKKPSGPVTWPLRLPAHMAQGAELVDDEASSDPVLPIYPAAIRRVSFSPDGPETEVVEPSEPRRPAVIRSIPQATEDPDGNDSDVEEPVGTGAEKKHRRSKKSPKDKVEKSKSRSSRSSRRKSNSDPDGAEGAASGSKPRPDATKRPRLSKKRKAKRSSQENPDE